VRHPLEGSISGSFTLDPGAADIQNLFANGSSYLGLHFLTVSGEAGGFDFGFGGAGRVIISDNLPIVGPSGGDRDDFIDYQLLSSEASIRFDHADYVVDFIHGGDITQPIDANFPGGALDAAPNFIQIGENQTSSFFLDSEFLLTDLHSRATSVPEPGSLVMLLTALGGVAIVARRRQQ
jgi:hypothetical protein